MKKGVCWLKCGRRKELYNIDSIHASLHTPSVELGGRHFRGGTKSTRGKKKKVKHWHACIAYQCMDESMDECMDDGRTRRMWQGPKA
jgi:hypothetical protein